MLLLLLLSIDVSSILLGYPDTLFTANSLAAALKKKYPLSFS